MELDFKAIDKKWRKKWQENEVYKVPNDSSKPKHYVLDMFPYPSGSGLHVGHPLGYVASDIYARYKRLKGYNVLHPMGYDAFGLPAEQYAIESNMMPQESIKINSKTFKNQLTNLGLSFDWSREIITCNPSYYKWTQWIFSLLYNSCYCTADDKAQAISCLIEQFEKDGNLKTAAYTDYTKSFTASDWKGFSPKQKDDILMHYRLAYKKISYVNWCEALGTVLANDEVINGLSERGGFPVEQRSMLQWSLRITAYADRLLNDIEALDWSESIKAQQKNWIGKSEGAGIFFTIDNSSDSYIEVFTTRPDTIFGVSFLVLAPEHPIVQEICSKGHWPAVKKYIENTKAKSAIERQSNKEITGAFIGTYAVHPFTKNKIPIWISEYVLSDYGTGAIMAVPSDDERDYNFALHFGLEIIEVCDKSNFPNASKSDKVGTLINSEFLNGLSVSEAIKEAIKQIEKNKYGYKKTNYKIKDANFSRQRYWGEPFPIYYDENGVSKVLPKSALPLELPILKDIKPEHGKPPLTKAKNWSYSGHPLDTDTMPGNAGSSWYFFRYMDPQNSKEFCNKDALNYWKEVDLYIGGTEHAVGHLLYARFWTKFLYDLNYVPIKEPFKKLVNQGMIQGESAFIYVDWETETVFSAGTKKSNSSIKTHININVLMEHNEVNIIKLKEWRPEYKNFVFVLENNKLIAEREIEKMSKSKFNVVNPDDVIEKYGADCFRMFEMFLGPIENHKPWQTKGIDGVYRFIRKWWLLHFNNNGSFDISLKEPKPEALKSLHSCIKKVTADIEKLSFNTCISHLMICVNELTDLKCNNREILEKLCILLAPFAPHICEEVWNLLGNKGFVVKDSTFPIANEKYLIESSIEYPVSINGKMRTKITLPIDTSKEEAMSVVLSMETIEKWLDGKEIKKFIFVPSKIINIVI